MGSPKGLHLAVFRTPRDEVFTDAASLPEELAPSLASFAEHMPGWARVLWSDADVERYLLPRCAGTWARQ